MMDDLIRRIDAINAINTLYYPDGDDLVKVVRCRECKYGSANEYYGNVYCTVHSLLQEPWIRGPQYFCADGKRREDGDAGICESCACYPPSVTDEKPCCICDTDDPMLNCYQPRVDEPR